jgi:hypothetical protein
MNKFLDKPITTVFLFLIFSLIFYSAIKRQLLQSLPQIPNWNRYVFYSSKVPDIDQFQRDGSTTFVYVTNQKIVQEDNIPEIQSKLEEQQLKP